MWRRLLLSLLLLLLLPQTFPLAADAAGPELTAWSEDGISDELDDDTLFVVGNTLFAVYHELGHALVDLLHLPVIGREEDAVDGFAAVTMIPKTPDSIGDALIVAVADGWQAQSDVASERGERRYWGQHALDEQRHFAVVCLMVGSDQDGFYDYALEAGLPEERIETCLHDFRSMRNGWNNLLDPHKPEAKRSEGGTAASIDLLFDKPLPEQEGVFEQINRGGLLQDAVLGFGDSIALPSPITIRFTICNQANAYWSPGEREVKVCYELIEAFQAILLDATSLR